MKLDKVLEEDAEVPIVHLPEGEFFPKNDAVCWDRLEKGVLSITVRQFIGNEAVDVHIGIWKGKIQFAQRRKFSVVPDEKEEKKFFARLAFPWHVWQTGRENPGVLLAEAKKAVDRASDEMLNEIARDIEKSFPDGRQGA